MNEELNEKLITFINDILENVFLLQFVISIVGVCMNLPHLFILLQNSMRTSSTNSIMIGIALSDLIVLSECVYERVQTYWFFNYEDPCINTSSYWYLLSILIGDFLLDTFQKCSFWLGVFLALIRLIIMKLPSSFPKLSQSLFGYVLTLLLIAVSSFHSAYYYAGYRIVTHDRLWTPPEECTGFPANYTEQLYARYFVDNENLAKIGAVYQFIYGVTKITVSVLYPVLTLLLIIEIRKSAKFASEALSKRSSEERHRTGRMILVMTIFYVVASAPAGASDFVQLFVSIESNSILETLVGYGSIFILVLFCLNAASHGLINFTMSSKYRKTVRSVLKKDRTVSTISNTKTSSHY